MLSTIDRVMNAYTSKYELSPAQAVVVRAELSSFIGQLMSGTRPETTMVPELMSNRAHLAGQGMVVKKPG